MGCNKASQRRHAVRASADVPCGNSELLIADKLSNDDVRLALSVVCYL